MAALQARECLGGSADTECLDRTVTRQNVMPFSGHMHRRGRTSPRGAPGGRQFRGKVHGRRSTGARVQATPRPGCAGRRRPKPSKLAPGREFRPGPAVAKPAGAWLDAGTVDQLPPRGFPTARVRGEQPHRARRLPERDHAAGRAKLGPAQLHGRHGPVAGNRLSWSPPRSASRRLAMRQDAALTSERGGRGKGLPMRPSWSSTSRRSCSSPSSSRAPSITWSRSWVPRRRWAA